MGDLNELDMRIKQIQQALEVLDESVKSSAVARHNRHPGSRLVVCALLVRLREGAEWPAARKPCAYPSLHFADYLSQSEHAALVAKVNETDAALRKRVSIIYADCNLEELPLAA